MSIHRDYAAAKASDWQAEYLYLVGSEWQMDPGPGPELHPQSMLYQQGSLDTSVKNAAP